MEEQKHGVPALLSFFLPGLGQIIKGEVGKGLGILFLSVLGIVVIMGLSAAGSDAGAIAAIFLIGLVPFWLWQVYDAYNHDPTAGSDHHRYGGTGPELPKDFAMRPVPDAPAESLETVAQTVGQGKRGGKFFLGFVLGFGVAGVLFAGLFGYYVKKTGTEQVSVKTSTREQNRETFGSSTRPAIGIPRREEGSDLKARKSTESKTTMSPVVKERESKIASVSTSQAKKTTEARPLSVEQRVESIGVKHSLPVGPYEVVYSTPLYSEPSENSRRVANLEAGTKVHIVDIQGDWLEVRSKHGRPPGFMKKDSAMPMESR